MQTLKSLRTFGDLTQQQAAEMLGVSLRSYKSYENDPSKAETIKYQYLTQKLEEYVKIDENHGVLTLDKIREICSNVLTNYDVEYCFLFGSYAKGKEKEESDIDLLISTNIKGIKFYGLVEDLRSSLHKRVDVLSTEQLKDNYDLTLEVLRDGIKIYG